MATMSNDAHLGEAAIRKKVRAMADGALMGQELTVQGAINACGFFLQTGCSEAMALKMLEDLRYMAKLCREETARRGRESLFPVDQTGFA